MAEEQPAEALDEVASAAQEKHVVVVGGGIAGLVAALECAKVGLRVTLIEQSDRLGGAIRSVEAGGLSLDAAVEGWSIRGAAVRALAEELGLAAAIVPAAVTDTWIGGLPGVAPLPERSIVGIPDNPWDVRVRRIIGWRGTWRAYLDRVRPPLTIGKERSLGKLVRTRMGDAVLERLVAPLSLGVYGTHPDDVDVEAVAPGLSTALTRTGSLSGAVFDLLVDATPGPRLEGLAGGMPQLVEAAHERLVELGAVVRTGVRADRLERHDDGRWTVETAGDAPEADAADQVVVATPEAEARRLLAPVVPSLDAPVEVVHPVEVVTLVVADAALDAAPLAAVYPLPGTSRAVAVVDSTARWPWVAAAAGSGVRVLRVFFGAAGEPAATAGLDDAAAAELARGEASTLLGVGLRDVRGAARAPFEPPRPASALGHAEAADAARQAIRTVDGLAAVGAWLAGSGLAQVVPDALKEGDRVRRMMLWNEPGE
ncbi:protoporphyrinogen/coproporphyrinogen oxidase [Microbacterium sp. B2969]|uniref:Protoporphyrinogen/coproporphyrinogen oxidase n=1 Tax=Microbacterium alkaliflavum TaxID=3248839 RepID=A0ABW7Q8T4_9MICO